MSSAARAYCTIHLGGPFFRSAHTDCEPAPRVDEKSDPAKGLRQITQRNGLGNSGLSGSVTDWFAFPASFPLAKRVGLEALKLAAGTASWPRFRPGGMKQVVTVKTSPHPLTNQPRKRADSQARLPGRSAYEQPSTRLFGLSYWFQPRSGRRAYIFTTTATRSPIGICRRTLSILSSARAAYTATKGMLSERMLRRCLPLRL